MLQNRDSVYIVMTNSLLMLAGALSVYLILIPITIRSKDLLKAKNLLIISRIFGIIIFGYGVLYLNKLVQLQLQ